MNDVGALVVVTTSFPSLGDGSEAAGSFVSDFVEEVSKLRPVRVVAPGRVTGREYWADGVDLFRFQAPGQPLSTLQPWRLRDLLSIRRVLVHGKVSTREAVAYGPTSHILALWALPSGYWARCISRETGVPYSVWTLGSDIWSLGRLPVVRSYLRRVLFNAHACFSDGIQLAQDTSRIGRREAKFLPSTRRIERKRTEPLRMAPPYRLLFLGRWHVNKGIDLLIDALKMLSDADWQRIETVEICGGGPLEAMVHAGVEALRSDARPVEWRGYLDKAAAEGAILRADYLLIPSRIESIPVVFSDAIKLSCPVLSMPVGDLPYLLSLTPACGLVADSISPRAFSLLIAKAVRCTRAPFVHGLKECAARFSLDSSTRRLMSSLDLTHG